MKNLRANLGRKIKELRLSLKFTQAELAEVAGIDYKYLQRIESSETPNLTLETIEKLAKALKTTPAKLLEI
jgi:transcriptional regulator with XRE-family HTH domain